MNEALFLEERRRAIFEQLKRAGRVSVKELSEQLNVSAVTIRQDLRALEKEGMLERTYGGAMLPTPPNVPEVAFDIRREANYAEKNTIGRAAAALVQNGYAIGLDASTTAYAVTPYLKMITNLTIVTSSIMIAQQFVDSPHINVIMPGGKLRRDSMSLVGNPGSLPDINLNLGFFSARGLTLEAGLTDLSPEQAELKRALIARCLSVVALIDSTKWGQVLPYTYAYAHDMTRIITTSATPHDLITQIRKSGVTVDVVSAEG